MAKISIMSTMQRGQENWPPAFPASRLHFQGHTMVSGIGSSEAKIHLSTKPILSGIPIPHFSFLQLCYIDFWPWLSLSHPRGQSLSEICGFIFPLQLSMKLVFSTEKAAWMHTVWSGSFRTTSTTHVMERCVHSLKTLCEKLWGLSLSVALCLSARGFLCPLLFLQSTFNYY